jgi:small GTP-binding protein
VLTEQYVVFTGRPNAGKSSLIKTITGLDVATGKRPGTTRRVSKYPITRGLVLVDMPGFGRMLGATKRHARRINTRIIRFVEYNAQDIILAIHVLDISTFLEVTQRLEKKGFMSVDVEMVQFLATTLKNPPLVAANKIDKKDQVTISENFNAFLQQLSTGQPPIETDQVYPVSAKTLAGIGDLKSAIHGRLVIEGYRTPFKSL